MTTTFVVFLVFIASTAVIGWSFEAYESWRRRRQLKALWKAFTPPRINRW